MSSAPPRWRGRQAPEVDFCENLAPKICTPPLFPRLLGTETSEPPREEKRPRNSVRRLYSLDISAPNTENPKFCTPPLYLRKIRVQNKTPKKTVRRLYSLDFSGFSPARVSRTHVVPDPKIRIRGVVSGDSQNPRASSRTFKFPRERCIHR